MLILLCMWNRCVLVHRYVSATLTYVCVPEREDSNVYLPIFQLSIVSQYTVSAE